MQNDASVYTTYMLFDIVNDPYETNNLANDDSYAHVLTELKRRLVV